MNKVTLMGRLTRDPNVTQSSGEKATTIARFTLAVDRRVKREEGQQSADFISCVAFGKSAEFADKYLRQGTKIAVVGRIQSGQFQNKDGQTVYTTDVIVEEMEFAESKRSAEASGSQAQSAPQTRSTAPAQARDTGFIDIPESLEDELPFS